MGPPLEHGGMSGHPGVGVSLSPLQWGRRLNTAEWDARQLVAGVAWLASMGPPLEHGGMYLATSASCSMSYRFNGAAA